MKNVLRRSAAGLALAGLHSAWVLHVWRSVAASEGTFLNGFRWLPVAAMDFPVTAVAAALSNASLLDDGTTTVGLTYLIAGGLYWLLLGTAAQAACRDFLRRTAA